MAKWARVNLIEESSIGEIITYDPVGVINEAFLPQFKECPDEVYLGYHYNPQTNEYFLPDNYAKHPDFQTFGYIKIPEGLSVDENGFVVFPPPPKTITEELFRSKLKIQEKILWDNSETGTSQQKALINTMKLDFPFIGIETIRDELDLLESVDIIGVGRADEIYNSL